MRRSCVNRLCANIILTQLQLGAIFAIIASFFVFPVIDTTLVYGARPTESYLELIPGNNDDPYIDRVMACVLIGRV